MMLLKHQRNLLKQIGNNMEAYELHRGNYVTYNSITVKFISFVDDKCKKCTVQYPDGKTKTVWASKLNFIEVDDEFLLNNNFHRDTLKQYEDHVFHSNVSINKNGFHIIYHTYIDDLCVTAIKVFNIGGGMIESIGDGSVSHFQSIINLAGHPEFIKDLKIKKSYNIIDDNEELITF